MDSAHDYGAVGADATGVAETHYFEPEGPTKNLQLKKH